MGIQRIADPSQITATTKNTSRRALLKGAAIGGVGLAVGGFKGLPALADSSESLQTIINIALTAELLAVTTYSNAIASFSALGLDDGTGVNFGYLRGALAAEADHVSILELLGAYPLASAFNYPSGMFTSGTTFSGTLEALETAFVAAYLVAVKEAAAAGRPDIAQLAARHASVEAEHRVNARNLLNKIPSNNSSFESLDGFNSVGDAAAALVKLGFIPSSGTGAYAYPGPVAPDFTNIVDRRP